MLWIYYSKQNLIDSNYSDDQLNLLEFYLFLNRISKILHNLNKQFLTQPAYSIIINADEIIRNHEDCYQSMQSLIFAFLSHLNYYREYM